jgi:hypothetical protein
MQSTNLPEWEAPIPDEWRISVLGILRDGKFGRDIIWPNGVSDRWDADTLGNCILREEVRYPLIDALSVKGVIGMLEPRIQEPGVSYAFFFSYRVGCQMEKFYGKICLFDTKVKIKLLSTHLPDQNKGQERL